MRGTPAQELYSLQQAGKEPLAALEGTFKVVYPAPGDWHARLYSHYAELETIWRRMEKEGHCTVFQTYDWAASWYDAALSCGEAKPVIIVVSQEGTGPVWILPLCLYKKKGMRVISFADQGVTDYAAPLMARGAPWDAGTIQNIIKAAFRVLPPCDVIHFQKLLDKIDGIFNPLLSLRGLERFPVNCYGIRLGKPWPQLAEEIMQRRLRLTIRRQKRRLGNMDVAFSHHDSPEQLGPFLEQLMAMRRTRFEAIGLPDMPPLWQNFYQVLATRPDRQLKANITIMTISGEVIATCFGVTHGETYHALLTTFKMGRWEKFRPGMLLFDAMLENFAEQTTEKGYFDFSVGDEVYKQRFGAESHSLYEWMLPRSAKGLAFFAAWRAKHALRRYPKLYETARKFSKKVFITSI